MNEIECYPVDEELAKTRPMAAKYAQVYGMWNLMSEDWPSADFYAKGFKNSEGVYAACLVKGVTWKELLNFSKKDLKDVIL